MYTLSNQARAHLTAYIAQIASLNGVAPSDANKSFTVAPSVAQTLQAKLRQSSDFLGRINMPMVKRQEGGRLMLGAAGLLASRTDTSGDKRRKTRSPTGLSGWKYRLEQTNFDTHLRYELIDMWAEFPNFQIMVRDAILKLQARDIIRVGFHGLSAEDDTDADENPNGEDVNKGWLQIIREAAPAQVIGSGAAGAPSKINIGASQDFNNLDALVYDMITGLHPNHQEGTDLVAIVGRELLHDKYFPLVNQTLAPSEQTARDVILSQKMLGGLPAARVPDFPADKILVTSFDNLSVYTQEGTRRRLAKDNPEADRYENFESVNQGYVVEDFEKAILAENIVIGSGTTNEAGAGGLVQPHAGDE